MEIIDIVLGIVLLFGLVKGLMNGLLKELASLLALVLGIYGAMHFSFYAKDIIVQYIAWEARYVSLIAFAITFLAIVIGISLAGKLLTKLAESISLGFVNRILGAVFGLLKVGLILSVFVGWIEKANGLLPFISEEQKEKSILYAPVKNLSPMVFPTLMEKLGKKEITKDNKDDDQQDI